MVLQMSNEFTTKEKVLVNLLEFFSVKDRYPRPIEMTQEGMAERTGSKQNTISYAVRNLVDEGLVYEETTRVKTKDQRLKAYFLTEKGIDEAKEIKNKMAHLPVKIEVDGKEKVVPVKDINMYYHTRYSLLEIILHMENGTFKMMESKEDISKVAYLHHVSESPNIEPKEYNELINWWSGDGKVFMVQGEEGSGKTTLLTKFVHSIIEERNIFYFKIRDWYTQRYLWDHLANFLSSTGEHKLYAYLEASKDITFKEALRALTLDLKHLSDAVIIIEDIEKVDNIRDLVYKISENIKDIESTRIILSGKPGLISSEKEEKIGAKTLNLDYREYDKPMFVELGNAYNLDEGSDIVLDVVLEGMITPEEFIAIAYMSIHRLPVERSEVIKVGEVNRYLFNELLQTPMLSRTIEDKVLLHDFVKERVVNRLWVEEQEILHSFAEEYYYVIPSKIVEEKIEYLYHSIRAGDIEGFLNGLHDYAEEIISSGFSEQLINEIECIDVPLDKQEEGGVVSFWKGEAHRTIHEYDKAIVAYNEILDICNDEEIKTRAHMGIASVLEAQKQFKLAIERYELAIKNAQDVGKDRDILLGNIYQNLSNLYSNKGSYDKAKEYLKKAIALLEEQNDYSLLTTLYLLSAKLEKESGDLKAALKYLEKGMKSWRFIEETYQRAGGLHDIGSFYKVLRELEGAEEFLTESIDICEQFGYTHLKGLALLKLTECYIEKGDSAKAISSAEDAKDIFNFLDLDEEEAYSYALLGQAYAKLERNDEAECNFNRSITIYHKIDSSYALGLVYFSMAKLQEKNGNKTGVAENYRKSVISLISSGADDMAEQVERVMKTVPLTM